MIPGGAMVGQRAKLAESFREEPSEVTPSLALQACGQSSPWLRSRSRPMVRVARGYPVGASLWLRASGKPHSQLRKDPGSSSRFNGEANFTISEVSRKSLYDPWRGCGRSEGQAG